MMKYDGMVHLNLPYKTGKLFYCEPSAFVINCTMKSAKAHKKYEILIRTQFVSCNITLIISTDLHLFRNFEE